MTRARGHRPQPRPRRRTPCRTRPRTSHRRDPATQGLHRARPARSHRTTTTPAPARILAIDQRDHARTQPHQHEPAPDLTPIPASRISEKPADQQDTHAHTHASQSPRPRSSDWALPPKINGGSGLRAGALRCGNEGFLDLCASHALARARGVQNSWSENAVSLRRPRRLVRRLERPVLHGLSPYASAASCNRHRSHRVDSTSQLWPTAQRSPLSSRAAAPAAVM